MQLTSSRRLPVLLLPVLVGCSSGDEFGDLREFMADIEARPVGRIAPLPEFEPYQPFTYGTTNRRSPFEPPVIIRTPTRRQGEKVEPPDTKPKEYLERFNLGALRMVGTLERESVTYALVKDSQNFVHRVQIGDYMGQDFGRVDEITPERMEITEIVSDGMGGWLRRPRSIELSE